MSDHEGDHEVTMPDGSHVTWESWSLGDPKKDRTPILREDQVVGEYVRHDGKDSIEANGTWALQADENSLSGTLPDGRVYSATSADGKKIARSKAINVDFGDSSARIVCEGSTNYVIENDADKIGQFTGASRGVRHAEIQYDTEVGRALPDEQKIFLAWTARRVLEARMVSSTWILTICLILLIAYLAWAWVA
ncbi:hypothetical protein [Corynebacterium sp. H113]|uniref:hypothetical protein n=1 Tax=Corynebacterium sp. H113 TaxID=3133419 RepID=UPI0030B3002D